MIHMRLTGDSRWKVGNLRYQQYGDGRCRSTLCEMKRKGTDMLIAISATQIMDQRYLAF